MSKIHETESGRIAAKRMLNTVGNTQSRTKPVVFVQNELIELKEGTRYRTLDFVIKATPQMYAPESPLAPTLEAQ